MSLKAIAKNHRVNAVTFYMMPHSSTLAFQQALRWAREKWGEDGDQWPIEAPAFIASCQAIIDLEFDHDASDEELWFKAFWENRTHDLDTDWVSFLQCMTYSVVNALEEAYAQTRKTPLQADAALQVVPDEQTDDSQKKDAPPSSDVSESLPAPEPKKTSRKNESASVPATS